MSMDKVINVIVIIVLTVLSGLGDANGFSHAANMWNKGRIVLPELTRAVIGFTFGIATFMVSIRYFQKIGIVTPEMQTIGWMVVTIIGVAIIGGRFIHWQAFDQILAVAIIIGLCIIILRTNG